MNQWNGSSLPVNPQYRSALEDWLKCDDCFAGEREIKNKGELYLPKTEGQMADSRFGNQRYAAYKERANYFNYFASTASTMLGIMHREPPEVIELPEKIGNLKSCCSSDGLNLMDTLRRINMLQLIYGRCGILLDIPYGETSPDAIPVATLYPPHRIPDWSSANTALDFILLDESGFVRKRMGWESEKKYRLCALSNAQEYYSITLSENEYLDFDPESAEIPDDAFPEVQGRRLHHVPFVFTNVTDICSDIQKPPLLPLANLCLAIYRGEADYRHALFMQAQSTLFLKGFHLDDPPMMGAGNYIHTESPDASGSFLEISGAGLLEMRSAQNDLHTMAENMGISLENSSVKESGEALKTRLAVKTALMRAIAVTGASALRNVLATAAEWCSADPAEVQLKANLDFNEGGVSASEVQGLWNAKNAGLPLSSKSIHTWLRENDFTDLSYPEELEELHNELKPSE